MTGWKQANLTPSMIELLQLAIALQGSVMAMACGEGNGNEAVVQVLEVSNAIRDRALFLTRVYDVSKSQPSPAPEKP